MTGTIDVLTLVRYLGVAAWCPSCACEMIAVEAKLKPSDEGPKLRVGSPVPPRPVVLLWRCTACGTHWPRPQASPV